MYFTNSQETWDSVCVLGFSLRSDLSSQGHTFGEPVFSPFPFFRHNAPGDGSRSACVCFLASHGENRRLIPFTSRNSLGSGAGLVDSSPSMPKSVQFFWFYWKHWCTNLPEKKRLAQNLWFSAWMRGKCWTGLHRVCETGGHEKRESVSKDGMFPLPGL